MVKKQITIIGSSPNGDKSKSNAILNYAYEQLTTLYRATNSEISINVIDVHSIKEQDSDFSSKDTQKIINQIRKADALIIGSPIYNWNISSLLSEFMTKVIDSDKSKHYQYCIFAGGAGSPLSLFAFEGLARSLTTELNSIIIGKPILATDKDIVNLKKQKNIDISDEVKTRMNSHLEILFKLLLV
jgi:NAD(P)H-dependent FMN reductase